MTEKKDKEFWDLDQFVEPKKYISNTKRNTIDAIPVSIGNQNHDQRTERIPSRQQVQTEQQQEVKEFTFDSGLIRKLSIKKWKREIERFEMFRNFAKSIANVEPQPAEYAQYVSYMPLFEQMSKSQLNFYIYWKSQVKNGVYPYVESSYIILFSYEIVNLPDVYSPEEGAKLFADLIINYGKNYAYLYRNLGECLIDWCLLRKTKVPEMPISVLEKVVSAVSLPELFFNSGDIPKELLYKFSLYAYKDNKVYKSFEDKEKWDKLIAEGAYIGASEIMKDKSITDKLTLSHMVRDCFQSAPVASCSKYWISVEYLSLTRNVTLRTLIGYCYKVAENEVRDILGARNSIKTPDLPEHVISAIKEYYAENYPQRLGRSVKKSEDDEEYMALYEPENKEADIDTAEKIEEEAWDTAIKLGAESEEEQVEANIVIDAPVYYSEDSYGLLLNTLEEKYAYAVKAAAENRFESYCRENCIMTMEAERIINEKAMEITGDQIIESGVIIEDYAEDISRAIKERG